MVVLIWEMLVRLYRRCRTRVMVQTVEYVLTPNSRFYIFIIGQVLLVFLIAVGIRFWVATFEAALVFDPYVREPFSDELSSIFDYSVYLYSTFSSECDPYANVPYIEMIELTDNYDFMYDTAEYLNAVLQMPEDFEAGVEDFEERGTKRFFVPGKKGRIEYFLQIDGPDQIISSPALHYYLGEDPDEIGNMVGAEEVDDDEEYLSEDEFIPDSLSKEEEKFLEEEENTTDLENKFHEDWAKELFESLKDEYAIDRNRLSSVSRIYLSGFFDYGYEYTEPRSTPLFEFPEEFLTKGVPLSYIDFTDFIVDTEIIYDDIIAVTIDLNPGEETKEQSALYNSFEVFEDKEKDATYELLGIDNLERNFVHYANSYSEDIYDDFFDSGIEDKNGKVRFFCLASDIRGAVR